MQLMVSYVTACAGQAETEAVPIRLRIKRGQAEWLEMTERTDRNAVY
jgi:hypothetical protein